MDDIVVVDVHQHSDGLANDERDPHSGVAIVSSQESTHKPSQGNLGEIRVQRSDCVCLLHSRDL